MRRTYSTGFPELDRFLGGIVPGDSILLLISSPREAHPFLRGFLNYERNRGRRVLYPRLTGSRDFLLTGLALNVPGGSARRPSGAGSLARLLATPNRAESAILDDLADWNGVLRKEAEVASNFAKAAASAARSGGILVATALRSEFTRQTLASLKESVSICLDCATHGGEVHLSPVHLKGRYAQGGTFSFQILESRGGKPRRLAPLETTDAPRHGATGAHKMERMAAEILEGPLGRTQAGLAVADLHGLYIAANERLRELGGIADNTPLTEILSLIVPPGRRALLRMVAKGKKSLGASADLRILTKAGKDIPVHVRSIPADSGLGIFLVERAERRGRLTGTPLAVGIADRRRMLEASSAFMTLAAGNGASTAAAAGEGPRPLSGLFPPRTLKELRAAMDAADQTHGTTTFDGSLHGRGKELRVRIGVAAEGSSGDRYLVTVTDLTEISSGLEASRREAGLFKAVVEHLSLPVATIKDGAVQFMNAGFMTLLGLEGQGGKEPIPLARLFPGEDAAGIESAAAKFLSSKQPSQTMEAVVRGASGKSIEARLALRKMAGLPAGMLLLELEDTTDRKREEARLAGLQEGTERITTILQDATGTLEYEKVVRIALDRSLDVLGWSGGAVFLFDEASKTFGARHSRHVPKALLEKLSALPSDEGLGGFVSKTLESHIFTLDQYPSYLPYRTLFREHRVQRISLIPLVHGETPAGFILGISQDGRGPAAGRSASAHQAEALTTLGRQLGNALANARTMSVVRESEQRLHTVVDSLAGVVYTTGPDGMLHTIDPAVTAILGYAPKDFARNRGLFLSLLHEQDKKLYLERVTGSESLGSGFVKEYRMRPKAKAGFRWMRDTVTVVRDAKGNVEGFTGILADITDERERIAAVISERSMLRTVQDVLPDGVAVFDAAGLCVEWNPTMEILTGHTRAAALGKNAHAIAPMPQPADPRRLDDAVATRRSVRLGLVQPHGKHREWYEAYFVPVPGTGDGGMGFLLRYTDVTARQAELDHLLQSEKILLNVINAMDDVMMITDLEGRVVEVNQAFLKVMRYPRSQVVGREFPYPWLVERDMSRFLVWITRIREQQWLHDFDITWVPFGGGEVQMSLNTTLIRNSMGEPVAMLNIARDISERVRLSHDVESRNHQIELINRVVTIANRSNDFGQVFAAVADEVVQIMPAAGIFVAAPEGPDSPFSRSVVFDGDPADPPAVSLFGGAQPGETAAAVPDGVVHDLLESPFAPGLAPRFRSAVILPVEESGRRPSFLVVAAREPHAYSEEHAGILRPLAQQLGGIISRLRLFAQVLSDSTYVGNLLDSIDSPVYTVDRGLVITRINRAGTEFLGAIAGHRRLEGAPLFGVLPDSPLRDALRRALDRAETGFDSRASEDVAVADPGGERTTRLTVNALREGERTTGFVFSHADITELKANEEELRSRARQLTILHEISAVISNTFDIGAILASALTLLKESLGARGLIVYLAGPGGSLELAHQEGFPREQALTVRSLHPDLSITADVVRRRAPSYIGRLVSADPRIAPNNRVFLEENAIEAMGVVPIVAKEKVLGALDVFYDAPHEFPEQERHVLNLAGNQLGAAIENVHLYEELKAQVGRLSVLFELSQRLTSLLDTSEIYRAAFDHIRRVVPCDLCEIAVPGTTGEPSVVMRAVRAGLEYRIEPLPAGGDLAGVSPGAAEVLSSRRTLRGSDGRSVVVPMVSEEAITGVIGIACPDDRPLDDVQVRLLESVASLTAIAVQKAGLYEETVHTSEQIEKRNKELDDFTYVVSHDLKEPLISIEGFSRILQMDYGESIQAEGREYLDSMVGATTRMKGLIDDLLMLSRVSRPTESFKPVDIGAVVAEIRGDMEYILRKRNVDFRADPGLPTVHGNETQLKILFRNLIGNAVKFNDKPDPLVDVGFRSQENNTYLFWVRDNGIGIESEFFEKIFVIFQRLHRREEFEGSGAGLAIVRKIMEIHQGKIWVESQKGAGSTFCFTLAAPLGP